MFRLTMHPASDGDALLLSWGKSTDLRHALIDFGRTKDYRRLAPLLRRVREFDLVVLTHIDADHIEGAVPLFRERPLPFSANQVWFNGYQQLEAANDRLPSSERETLGAKQAEKITVGIINSKWRWNAAFSSGIVSTDSPEAKASIPFDGGLSLKLLSPDDRKLALLLPTWEAELKKAGLRTTDPDEVEESLAAGRVNLSTMNVEALARLPFKEDTTKPNGASIAFLAEASGKRILLAGDAHPGVIERALRARSASEAAPLRLDCLKVSHHGSKANTSPTLLKLIDCTCFAFSTDGTRHDHPDPEAIARILVADQHRPKTLVFNFRQENTEIWDDENLKKRWNYDCVFPTNNSAGASIDLLEAG
uniref:Metallo-beta-lactamase domain-containing protein n=1 Tax=Bradyrhizobium septentrionale TaxID=1404411 RepID=A0A973W8U4_9BRAD